MEMVGKDYDGVDVKGMRGFHPAHCGAEEIHMIDQQGPVSFRQVDREKIGPARDTGTSISHGLRFLLVGVPPVFNGVLPGSCSSFQTNLTPHTKTKNGLRSSMLVSSQLFNKFRPATRLLPYPHHTAAGSSTFPPLVPILRSRATGEDGGGARGGGK